MPLSVDAKEVLDHLNEMGYRNISAEQLKEFMKDLRKLIKYEDRLRVKHKGETMPKSIDNRFECLHTAATVSSRAKVKGFIDNPKKKRSKSASPARTRGRSRSYSKAFAKEAKLPLQKPETTRNKTKRDASKEKKITPMWIRPKSAPILHTASKSTDPVQLYQFYTDEWKKFKRNLPGENDHAELRWAIRHKLLGS